MTSRILQHVYDLTEPLTLADTLWEFLGGSSRVRRFNGDAATLLEALSAAHDIEHLVAANVATKCEAGELIPAPVIDVEPLEFLVLRQTRKSPPLDIVTTRGCLLDRDPPCFAANRDNCTASQLAKVPRLFLAATHGEVAILQKLGAAATLLAGLDSMCGAQLRRLLGRPASEDELPPLAPHRRAPILAYKEVSLTLVGCDLARLRPGMPPAVTDLLGRTLDRLDRFGFDLDLLEVWVPGDEELDHIRGAVEQRDLRLVVESVEFSLASSLRSALEFLEPDVPRSAEVSSATDMKGATQALREVIERAREEGRPLPSLKDAQERHSQLYQETVVLPLYDAAAATSNPVKRVLLYRAAELANELHRTDPLQRAAAVAGTPDDNPAADRPNDELLRRRRDCAQELADIDRRVYTSPKC